MDFQLQTRYEIPVSGSQSTRHKTYTTSPLCAQTYRSLFSKRLTVTDWELSQLFILCICLQKWSRICILQCMFCHYSISITLSPSHHSYDKHLPVLSIKQTQHFRDITFQCSSSTLIWTKGLGTMKTKHRRTSKCISSVNL